MNLLLIPLLAGDVVEVMTAEESFEKFNINFNVSWKQFIQKRNHIFTIHRTLKDSFETSLFGADGKYIVIEFRYVKRLVSRDKTPEDEKKWLTQK